MIAKLSVEFWSMIGAVVAALAAVSALFFNYLAIRENSRSRNIATFQSFFLEIRNLEEKYYKEYQSKKDIAETRKWLSLFFNTLEYFAFLVNNNLLSKKLAKFYNDAFVGYYEGIFITAATPEQQSNPKQYEEMKKLYKKLISK